jgi:hypothetical protein
MKQRKRIRTELDGGSTWFNAVDAFEVLGKQWKGKPYLLKKGLSKEDIRDIRLMDNKKASVFIRDRAFYRLLIAEAEYDSEVSEIVGQLLFNKQHIIKKLIKI